MKNSNSFLFVSFLISLGLFVTSCEKDDPVPEIDQEVITDITLKFTEVNEANEPILGAGFEVKAVDSEGISLGSSPQIDAINSLEAGKKYQLEIFLYNSIADEDLTEEVAEDDAEHQFYFLGSAFEGGNAFLTYSYNDFDGNGNPLGLDGYVFANESITVSMGTFRVVLRHGLNKDFAGANQPGFQNFEQAGGESDLDITFQVIL